MILVKQGYGFSDTYSYRNNQWYVVKKDIGGDLYLHKDHCWHHQCGHYGWFDSEQEANECLKMATD